MAPRGWVYAPGIQCHSEKAGKKLDWDTCVNIAIKLYDAGLNGTELEVPFIENEVRLAIGKPYLV